MTDDARLPLVMYGIWIPGLGWWKAPDHKSGTLKAYAEFRPAIARRYARWLGNGARAEVIDDSLIANEQVLLDIEKAKGERIWKLWKRLISFKR